MKKDDHEVAERFCSDSGQRLRPALFISSEGKPPRVIWIEDTNNGPTIRFTSSIPK